jgi:hypothetical protein
MDVGALASFLVSSQTAQLQLAIAARLLHMNGQAASSAGQLIDAAQQNMDRVAQAGAGLGENLDISA